MKVAAAFAEPEACCDKGGLPPPPCAHLAAFLAAPEALNKINLVKGFVGTLSSSNRFAKVRSSSPQFKFPIRQVFLLGVAFPFHMPILP